jgi:hypothetical protein
MNRERLRVNDQAGLISAQLTGWFWLGFLSSIALPIASLILLMSGGDSGKEEN